MLEELGVPYTVTPIEPGPKTRLGAPRASLPG